MALIKEHRQPEIFSTSKEVGRVKLREKKKGIMYQHLISWEGSIFC
jgi:hypothetical protein